MVGRSVDRVNRYMSGRERYRKCSSVPQRKAPHALVEIHYPRRFRLLPRPDFPHQGRVFGDAAVEALGAGGAVVFFVEGDVMVAGDDDLELSGGGTDGVECGLVFGDVADTREVAGVEEDVGGGQRRAVGVAGVVGGEWWPAVGVGDDGEASLDGFGGLGAHHVQRGWFETGE